MTNLHESMGPGRDWTRDPLVCNGTLYQLRYEAQFIIMFDINSTRIIKSDSCLCCQANVCSREQNP